MVSRRQMLQAVSGALLPFGGWFTKSADRATITLDGTTVPAEYATSLTAKLRGHMFRRSPPDYALVFPFSDVGERGIHMMFVPFPLDVVWVVDGSVTNVERLDEWTGRATHEADTVIELPVGMVDIENGDAVDV